MHLHDDDFYKWMESAGYVYSQNKEKRVVEEVDEYI